jgi:hypothetical protein
MTSINDNKAHLKAKLEILKLKIKLIQEQLDLLVESDKGYNRPKQLKE